MFRTAARLAAASILVLAVAAPSASAAGGMRVASGHVGDPVAMEVKMENVFVSSAAPQPLKYKLSDVLVSSAR